ncbi:MAG TPA: GNAT family N-acetyltransferase [Nocardioides sp.]|uniref:GNAT family N-acetyltransferase n=1 Tax=Nocardioides sp. TaxID=35761 RepID=UPI002CC53C8A|nr:GNAT family N-acetyltransferase [Nocardioides sp.]HQR26776.1 GNAT family N-acetyltransferase [Nocardioides sp.]
MIRIRPAEPPDDDTLAAIDADTWSPLVTPAPARAPGEPFFTAWTSPEDVLVAEVDGQVAGYVMLHQSLPLPSHAHVLELNGLAVAPGHQGQGLGRRLVEAAQQEARRRGATKLTLRVLAPNARARRLYEAAGFRVEGVLHGEFALAGGLVDDVLMAWHGV